MSNKKIAGVTTPFYSITEWKKLEKIADDAADLNWDYDRYSKKVEELLKNMPHVKKVSIKVDEMANWLTENKKPNTSENRLEYTQWLHLSSNGFFNK